MECGANAAKRWQKPKREAQSENLLPSAYLRYAGNLGNP